MNKFKIKKIPLETKKPTKTKLFFKIAVVFFTLSLVATGIGTIVHFIIDHQWRSPIIFQTPFYKEIKSPLVSMPVQEWEREDQGSTVSEGVTHQGDTTPLAEPYSIKDDIKAVFGVHSDKAFKVLGCENSTLNPNAVNTAGNHPVGSRDIGVFQINEYWQGVNGKFLFDPQINIRVAFKIFSDNGHSFERWTCGRNLGV